MVKTPTGFFFINSTPYKNMKKKYKLTKEVKEEHGRKLYRIKALIDFGNVKKGEKGGFIEKEENLSQENNAWVSGNAQVYGDARVSDNAWVYGDAQIYGDAWVYGNARVYKPIKLVGGYFYHTKRKAEKIETVDTYNDEYETLSCDPKIEEKNPTGKKVKIRLTEGNIVEGEIVE